MMYKLLAITIFVIHTIVLCPIAWAFEAAPKADRVESSPIDQILNKIWQDQSIQPAPTVSNEQFLRRIMLDLYGRIPTLDEQRDFLASSNRGRLIDQLLASEEFINKWSDVWTTQLYGYADESADRDTLATWLGDQMRIHRPYDEIATQLIASTGQSAFNGEVNFLIRYPEEPIVKVSRAFLGIRLDCARCHDHPFDRWTEEDFSKMNRFFDGMRREEVAPGNTRLSDSATEIDLENRPRFLTGAIPKTTQWRSELALFLTNSRPFARNFANRIWYQLMGHGIVHPVDDFSRDNPASIPVLLEWLTDEAQRSQFNIRHMIRLVCESQAYQMQSNVQADRPNKPTWFVGPTMKPLTPEQWYDSMCVAIDRKPALEDKTEFIRSFYGDALDGDFSATWEYRETVQGLMFRLVESVEPPANSAQDLFKKILCREPTADELVAFEIRSPKEVTFVLLHSSEFAFNH